MRLELKMLAAAKGYMVPFVEDLVKDFKELAEPPHVLQILTLISLRQFDAGQTIYFLSL